ncbi:MAG: glycosyltransferase [Thermoanaerobaculia bacterium]
MSSSTPRVSVIVPSAERIDLLEACLRSLVKNGPTSIPFEVIAIHHLDRAKIPASLAGLELDLRLVHSPVNLGLAGSGNRGRALARGELLVLLHDDAEIEPGWLEALVETADAHPEAGAVGSKVLFPDGRLQSAGMILWGDGVTSPPWVGAAPAATAFSELRAVDYCGTSSLLVRAATWDAMGGLEEECFPAYYVDVNLAMHVRRLEQSVLYEPRSVIRHHQGASGELRFRRFVTDRNREPFLTRWSRELEDHEPRIGDPGEAQEEAIARAVARANEMGRRACVNGAPAAPPEGNAALREWPVTLHERQNLERHLALLEDYTVHLTAVLGETATRAEAAQAALATLEQTSAREAQGSATREQALLGAHERITVLERKLAAELERSRERDSAGILERARLHAAAAASQAELQRITSLASWRLYTRLLPILKRLRAGGSKP